MSNVLVDSGYYSEAAVEQAGAGPTVYAATRREAHGRSVTQLEKRADAPSPSQGASVAEVLKQRMSTQTGRQLYALRKQTVEPVFGIIKEALGFRRFLLRGKAKVSLEWTLVSLAYNLKRLFGLSSQAQPA